MTRVLNDWPRHPDENPAWRRLWGNASDEVIADALLARQYLERVALSVAQEKDKHAVLSPEEQKSLHREIAALQRCLSRANRTVEETLAAGKPLLLPNPILDLSTALSELREVAIAASITGQRVLRRCEAPLPRSRKRCGRWFVRRPTPPHDQQRFCSVACRMRAHRERKKGAVTA